MNKKNNDYDIYSVFVKQNKYKSPIEIKQYDVEKDIAKWVEDKIHAEIVQQFGVFVDKDELVKALYYDRGQYEKGWIDGYETAVGEIFENYKKEIEGKTITFPKFKVNPTNFDRITESVEALAKCACAIRL